MSRMPEPSMGIGMMTKKVAVTIEIPVSDLGTLTDDRLATYWHVAQANPARYDDRAAGELTKRIGNEIIRRWLAAAPVEMHNHQIESYFWSTAGAVGKWTGPNGEFELDPETPEFQAALAKLKADEQNSAGDEVQS